MVPAAPGVHQTLTCRVLRIRGTGLAGLSGLVRQYRLHTDGAAARSRANAEQTRDGAQPAGVLRPDPTAPASAAPAGTSSPVVRVQVAPRQGTCPPWPAPPRHPGRREPETPRATARCRLPGAAPTAATRRPAAIRRRPPPARPSRRPTSTSCTAPGTASVATWTGRARVGHVEDPQSLVASRHVGVAALPRPPPAPCRQHGDSSPGCAGSATSSSRRPEPSARNTTSPATNSAWAIESS